MEHNIIISYLIVYKIKILYFLGFEFHKIEMRDKFSMDLPDMLDFIGMRIVHTHFQTTRDN